jgi:SAM-dependent methyltransferase
MDWREYWNTDHPIYVNARHRLLHYEGLARDIAACIPSPDAVVLDWGCGEAEAADRVARGCKTLYLFDTAPNVRANVARRCAGVAHIAVIDEAGLEALPDESLDMIVCVSVLQYLDAATLNDAMELWRDKLKAGGRLVVADVIPPNLNPLADIKALLAFGAQGGFLVAAGLGLVRTFFSDYRKLRGQLGLTTHAEGDFLRLLAANGFRGERADRNFGHNQARMTFVATRL